VIDPERANGRIGVREREVVGGLRMGKKRGIEVEADAERLRPIDPAGVMLRPDRIAVDGLAAELAVRRVPVAAMPPLSPVPNFSNPSTSSPCQQCSEMDKRARRCKAVLVSTPSSAKRSLAAR
jgi:hypothetical protein